MKFRATKRKMSGIPDPCMNACRLYFDKEAEVNRVILSRHVGRKPRGSEWKQCWDCKAWCRLGERQEIMVAKDRGHEATPPRGALEAFSEPAEAPARNGLFARFTLSFTDDTGVLHTLEAEDAQVTLPRLEGDEAITRLVGRMKDPS